MGLVGFFVSTQKKDRIKSKFQAKTGTEMIDFTKKTCCRMMKLVK